MWKVKVRHTSECYQSEVHRSGTPASSSPPSQASNNNNNNNKSKYRPASQASNRPQSQASNKPEPSQSRKPSSSPSISRPRQSLRGRSCTPRSLSAASQGDESDDDRNGAVTPTAAEQEDLPDVDEEEGEGDNAIETTSKAAAVRRRPNTVVVERRKVSVSMHRDNPGPTEPAHGVNDWPYEEDSEGVGTSGKVLQRPKGVRDLSSAYAPSDVGSSASTGTETRCLGSIAGLMVTILKVKLLDYEELRGMDLDAQDDHILALKLEIDLDVAVEINAKIRGDITLALLMYIASSMI